MRDAIQVFPRWISRGFLILFVLHDLIYLLASGIAIKLLPLSIEATLRPYAWIWIVTVGGGALSGLIGTAFRNVRFEVLGCSLMIGGLITYAVAIMARSENGLAASSAAAAIFLGAALAIGVRFFTMFAAIYLREDRHVSL